MRCLTAINGKRGVTLPELLVALGIAGVVVILLMPLFAGVRSSSQSVTCVNNMRQVYSALMSYAGEHHGHMPPGRFVGPDDMGNISLKRELEPTYIQEVPFCPALRLTAKGIQELPRGVTEKARLRQLGGYSFNGHFTRSTVYNLPGPFWGYPRNYHGPHQVLFLVEGPGAGCRWVMSQLDQTLDGYDVLSRRTAPMDHGDKKLNFIFLDGHAEAIAPTVVDGGYSWDERFSSSGADGKYIPLRKIWNAFP